VTKGLSRFIALGEAVSILSEKLGELPRLAPRFDKNVVMLISPLKVLEALPTAESLHRRGGERLDAHRGAGDRVLGYWQSPPNRLGG
jgi:hypothetical protein